MRQNKKNHTSKESPSVLTPPVERSNDDFHIVAIGASAGGLEAVSELLKYLDPDTGMAFLYVQHLSPDHKSMLSSLLSKSTSMKVQEATDKVKMLPNNVYVIPPDREMNIIDGKIKITPRPAFPKVNLPIDILFSSLASTHKENVIGVILSGSASDGTRGMNVIKQEGGLTFAQDTTAKFASMPRSAIEAGVVDFVLSPKQIAQEITHLSKHPYIKSNGTKTHKEDEIDNNNPDLKAILNLLHKTIGVDFSQYKMTTIKRRIMRRMLLYRMKSLSEYAALLKEKNDEVDILYQDLLINVTAFFRDTDAHQYLKNTLLPKLLKNKKYNEPLRIWVAACSTGQEAYSIAIALLEIQTTKFASVPIQIFATDLDANAIAKARIGDYTKNEVEEVAPKRLQRFYTKSHNGFRVTKSVRDMCVFAQHNILSDPPFAHLDFISCCNLLIYLDTAAQKKAIATFHYALNDNGYLMLGKAETVGQSTQLFTLSNKPHKIYARKNYSGTRTLPVLTPRFQRQPQVETHPFPEEKNIVKQAAAGAGLDKAIDAVMLSRYMPVSIIINHQLEILQFRGATDPYIAPSTGKATLNVLKMTHPEIAFELRSAISKAIKTKQPVIKSGIEVKTNNLVRSVTVEVVPLKFEWEEPVLLLLFSDKLPSETSTEELPTRKGSSDAKDRRIKRLEEELADARADMLSLTQEQEAFSEELQSANEEVVSSNEELQSINEELETSKEEIESANEELTTTNQELQTRNELLNESYDYTEAVIATIHESLVVLDKDFRVKSANKSFYKEFGLREEDTEGVLLYDLGDKQWDIPKLRELLEEIIPKNTRFHDFEIEHEFATIGKKTMLLNANRIVLRAHREQFILLTIVDITELRNITLQKEEAREKILRAQIESEENLRLLLEAKLDSEQKVLEAYKLADDYIRSVFIQAPVAIVVYKGASFVVDLINDKALEMWGSPFNKVVHRPLHEISSGLEVGMEKTLTRVYMTGEPFIAHEVPFQYNRNGKLIDGFFNVVLLPVRDRNGTISGIISVSTDVTQEILARKSFADSEKRYNMMMMQSPFAFAILKGKDMIVTLANDSVKEMWRKGKDIEGKPLLEVLPEIKDQPFPELLSKVYTTGVSYYAYETLTKLARNGKMEDVYFNFVYQPYREADETISGVTVIAVDVTNEVIAKKTIEEVSSKMVAIVQSSSDAIISKTLDGIITSWNPASEKIFGYTAAEMVGEHISKLIPADRSEEEPAIIEKISRGEIVEHFETLRLTKHGRLVDISLTVSPIKDIEGRVIGASKIARDITERKKAEDIIKESEQKFNTLANNIQNLAWITDGEGKVFWYNQRWYDYTGKTLEEMEGSGWEKLHHTDYVKQAVEFVDRAWKQNEPWEFTSPLRRHDGAFEWFLTRAFPIIDAEGKIYRWIVTSTNIEKQKMQSLEFENAVKDRTNDLIKANDALRLKNIELQNMNQELESFNYISNHDLQEPLRKIQTFASRLLEKENQNLSDTGKDYFNRMYEAANQMQTLIQDLITLSRINSTERNFESTHPRHIIERVKTDFHDIIQQKNATIEVGELCEVKIIPFQFAQLMQNLIGNSLKFSKPGVPPVIKIAGDIVKGNDVTVSENISLSPERTYYHIVLTDNGIGFEQHLSEQIFQLFKKLHGKSEYAGTGIGLAIVKKIVENHDGQITATGEIGKGARFDIYFPI